MSEFHKVGRLVFQQKGDFWNAYYALPGTMKGAVLMGSIAVGLVVNNTERKNAFMDMMRNAAADTLEELTGKHPTLRDDPLPEMGDAS